MPFLCVLEAAWEVAGRDSAASRIRLSRAMRYSSSLSVYCKIVHARYSEDGEYTIQCTFGSTWAAEWAHTSAWSTAHARIHAELQ